MSNRYDIYNYIQTLDPEKDCQEIVYLVGSYEYPWLIRKSLEFALFRTYAVPHTSEILYASGQFEKYGQKRYDDTTLLLAGIAEHGYDSEYGRTAIRRMNQLHRRWNINNEDFLYVLSTFVFEPSRWHAKYGWRKPSRIENLANFYFWREIGKRMNIKNIPETYEEFEQFNIEHEKKHFRYHPANEAIGEATIQIFLNWYPKPLRPIIRQSLYAFMEDHLLYAFGFTKPHAIFRYATNFGLKTLAFILRHSEPRKTPYAFTEVPNRTYPNGFNVAELGPHDAPKYVATDN